MILTGLWAVADPTCFILEGNEDGYRGEERVGLGLRGAMVSALVHVYDWPLCVNTYAYLCAAKSAQWHAILAFQKKLATGNRGAFQLSFIFLQQPQATSNHGPKRGLAL